MKKEVIERLVSDKEVVARHSEQRSSKIPVLLIVREREQSKGSRLLQNAAERPDHLQAEEQSRKARRIQQSF